MAPPAVVGEEPKALVPSVVKPGYSDRTTQRSTELVLFPRENRWNGAAFKQVLFLSQRALGIKHVVLKVVVSLPVPLVGSRLDRQVNLA